MEHEELIEKHLGINTPYWIKEKVDNAINEALRQFGVIKSVCDHDFISCGTKAVECTKCKQVFRTE